MEGETVTVAVWVAQTLVFAIFLAVVNERLVELFINPLFKRVTYWSGDGIDTVYLRYVALITGLGITTIAQVNLFELFPGWMPGWPGIVLSGFLIGGGSNLIHTIFNRAEKRSKEA